MPERNLLPKHLAQNIVNKKAFAEPGRMSETFTWIRKNKPLALAEVDGFYPFWVVSKYDDLKKIATDRHNFSTTRLPMILMDKSSIDHMVALTNGDPNTFRSLVTMDEPEHRKQRALFHDWFLPASLRKLENRIRQIACEVLTNFRADNNTQDFVADFAEKYPRKVIREIIGIPEDNEWRLTLLGNLLFSAQDEDIDQEKSGLNDTDFFAKQHTVLNEMCDYFQILIKERLDDPQNDILTLLSKAEIDGKPLEPMATLGHVISFASAGHHTSAATLANIVWLLAQHPEYVERLKIDSEFMSPFIQETLRFTSPAKHFMRTAINDIEIRGQQIKAGEWVYLSFPSANFDEDIFTDPFTFNPDRNPNRHFAFGIGTHRCIGQALAAMELRIFTEELLKRCDDITLTGTANLTEAIWVQGLKSLPVSFSNTLNNS